MSTISTISQALDLFQSSMDSCGLFGSKITVRLPAKSCAELVALSEDLCRYNTLAMAGLSYTRLTLNLRGGEVDFVLEGSNED